MKHFSPTRMISLALLGFAACNLSAVEAQIPPKTVPPNSTTEEKKRVELDLASTKNFESKVSDGEFQVEFLAPFRGRMAYVYNTFGAENARAHVALQDETAMSTTQGENQTKSLATYSARRFPGYTGAIFFAPQFSPDGNYVLLKFGIPWANFGRYYLYVFDVRNKSLLAISNRRLSYELVSWSPDGNYIAFVDGGDKKGEVMDLDIYNGPLKLYVCDWRTGEESLVAENDTIRGPFSWMAPHTLLYTFVPEQKRVSAPEGEGKDVAGIAKVAPPVLVPNVYKYSVEEKQATLIFVDGYLPIASPDGQSIACFGSQNAQKPRPLNRNWQSASNGRALIVVRSDGKERVALDVVEGKYPFVKWLPDGQHLLTVEQTKHESEVKAELKNWDIKTQTFQRLAVLNAKNSDAVPTSLIAPRFDAPFYHEVGEFVYLTKTEWIERDQATNTVKGVTSLIAVNVSTGKAAILSQVRGASMDWHENSN